MDATSAASGRAEKDSSSYKDSMSGRDSEISAQKSETQALSLLRAKALSSASSSSSIASSPVELDICTGAITAVAAMCAAESALLAEWRVASGGVDTSPAR